jgi:hypothetical protein
VLQSVIILILKKIFFKKYNVIDTKQPTYTQIYEKMSDWTLSSYDPSLNMKYAKILNAILDVAEVDPDIDGNQKHESDEDSEHNLNPNSKDLPPIDAHQHRSREAAANKFNNSRDVSKSEDDNLQAEDIKNNPEEEKKNIDKEK